MSTAQCKIYPLVTKVLFDGRTWMHCLRTVRMSLPLPLGAVAGRSEDGEGKKHKNLQQAPLSHLR